MPFVHALVNYYCTDKTQALRVVFSTNPRLKILKECEWGHKLHLPLICQYRECMMMQSRAAVSECRRKSTSNGKIIWGVTDCESKRVARRHFICNRKKN